MSERIRHALVMAAGRGRRLLPLTESIPKPMAPYLDKTLVAHGISRVRKHVQNVHVTVGYMAAIVVPHLFEEGVRTVFNTEGHPSCWWIYHTLMSGLDEPILVLTCDNVTDVDFAEIEDDYFAQGEPAGMLVPVHPVPGLDGDYIWHENGRVTLVDRNRPSATYCSGIQVLNPARVCQLTVESDDFYGVWAQLIEAGQLRCSTVVPERWFSVDTVEDLTRLRMGAFVEGTST